MPARRRDPEAHQETWHVYCGDVHVGTISMRSGIPVDEDPWGWTCGFYPGSEPGEYLSGTAATFDQARAEFGKAWPVFLAKRTDTDFTAFRRHRAFTAWKCAMWDAGCRMPTQIPDLRSRCFCGTGIDIPSVGRHIIEHHSAGQ